MSAHITIDQEEAERQRLSLEKEEEALNRGMEVMNEKQTAKFMKFFDSKTQTTLKSAVHHWLNLLQIEEVVSHRYMTG